jgi:hypothetical protein
VIGDKDNGAGLGHGRQGLGVVADVEFEPAHRRMPEILALSRKALVLHVHALELWLAGCFLDEPDQGPLDRRVARIGVAEEIFVHDSS